MSVNMKAAELRVVVRWKYGKYSKDFGHLAHHLSKISGIASSLSEKMDHGEVHELSQDFISRRLPDLVIIAQMIAKMANVDLATLIEWRGRELEERP